MIKSILDAKRNFDTALAIKITDAVSTMNMAYAFAILAFLSLPAILVQGNIVPAHTFPKWLISVSLISLVAWIAQTFLQLVLLSVIMVGQKIQADTTIKHVKKHLDKHHKVHMQEIAKIHKHLGVDKRKK